MKATFLLLAVVAVGVVSAQDYYYGSDPAPSMYAATMGAPVPPPPPPSLDAMMAGAPYMGAPAPMMGALPMQQAMLEQQMAARQAYTAQQQNAAANFNTEEADSQDEVDEADEGEEEAVEESEEGEEVEEGSEEEAEEGEEETEGEEEVSEEPRFTTRPRLFKGLRKVARAVGRAGGRVGRAIGKGVNKMGKLVKRLFKKGGKAARKFAKTMGKVGKTVIKVGKPLFKPNMGKPKNDPRAPSAKTPKAAGGKKLPPMPAPLPLKAKINCKKNPGLCIDAETPAEGEEPGDHSPRAVFKKKIEVIKKSLKYNNRNIAAESKWIEQVELIMKQYALKVKKVKEHVADERKAIKELLRQRRIILNEKKQKELEQKLKMATTELAALTDALQQVQKKERELGSGKGQLGKKIRILAEDLKKLRTSKSLDEAQALKKAD
jgi:hypothetical protein